MLYAIEQNSGDFKPGRMKKYGFYAVYKTQYQTCLAELPVV